MNMHGDFIWYELLTTDADAAADFYGAVVGWTSSPSGQPDMDYRFFHAGDATNMDNGVGGHMAITPDMAAGGAQPSWISYVGVDDVDASCTAVTANGGNILMPPMDMAGVGRMAMVADPAGAPFYVMRGASDDTSHSFAKYAPKLGHAAWNELITVDQAGAWTFYSNLFGWTKDGHMDMGPAGTYDFIKSDVVIGAIMPKLPMVPALPMAAWNIYFRVADIDAAVATLNAKGGNLLQDVTEIPGGEYSLTAMDPQGAAFGLVGPRT
jgi:uncharacterized protein